MTILCLMCGPEEVQHNFYRVESFDGDFDEKGVPVAHGAVPQAREFQGLEGAAFIALGADEAGFGIYEFGKVEMIPLVVQKAAYKVYGIEMCGM